MKKSLKIFCLVALCVSIFSCKKDKKEDEDDHDHNNTTNTKAFLQINHMIGDEAFELNKNYKTSNGITYQLSRVDYYLTKVKLMDDEMNATSKGAMEYLLVKAPESKYSLGTTDLSHIHMIKMFVGVDAESNKKDPSTYDEGHPLANQVPAMHWGWTGLYRFMVIEGKFDSDDDGVVDKVLSFHLGTDDLLRSFEGMIHKEVTEGEDFTLMLKADYAMLFNEVDLLTENATVTMDNKELAMKIADNAARIFTLIH